MIGMMTAAGKGMRMKKISGDATPKPLIKVKNKLLIEYGIQSMMKVGIKNIFIVVNHKHLELFQKELKQYGNLLKLIPIDDNNHVMESVSELSQNILNSKEYSHENICYWMADNVFLGDDHIEKIKQLNKMVPKESDPTTGLLIIKTDWPHDFITMKSNGDFEEKPKNPETDKTTAGVFVVNKAALEDSNRRILNKNVKEYTVWDSWMQNHNIVQIPTKDTWIDVGNTERYNYFLELIKD